MILFFISIILFFIILILFAFPQFSPIPYFPSNKKDLALILKALDLKNDQLLFDLGAGNGLVIFAAADEAYGKNLNTQFIATEINPILLLILHLRRLWNRNRKNIKVIYSNMFKMNFNNVAMKQCNNLTIYLYISPWFLKKTVNNIKKQIKNFKVVSYMYPIGSLSEKEKVIKGVNKIYMYNLR